MSTAESSTRPLRLARSAAYPMPARRPPAGQVFALQCHICQVPGHTNREPEAVEALLPIHNQLHHGGAPVAHIAAVPAACDICVMHLATLAVPVPEPGERPVAVCDSCSAGTGPMHGSRACDRYDAACPAPAAGRCISDGCPSQGREVDVTGHGPMMCLDCEAALQIGPRP